MDNGDSPMENGDFPMEMVDVPMEHVWIWGGHPADQETTASGDPGWLVTIPQRLAHVPMKLALNPTYT